MARGKSINKGPQHLLQTHLFHFNQGTLPVHSLWAADALRVNTKAIGTCLRLLEVKRGMCYAPRGSIIDQSSNTDRCSSEWEK